MKLHKLTEHGNFTNFSDFLSASFFVLFNAEGVVVIDTTADVVLFADVVSGCNDNGHDDVHKGGGGGGEDTCMSK